MGLSLALNTARSSLLATSSQIGISARNVAGADDPGYARKIASLVTGGGGSVAVVIGRAADAALFARTIAATSDSAEAEALRAGLGTLAQTVGDTADGTAPAARLGALNAALQAAANQPDNLDLARAALDRAGELARGLNAAAETVHAVRRDADAGMAVSVARIQDLLGRFETVNSAVRRGTAVGADVTDDLDDRDRILAALSEEIGINTVTHEGGDVGIYTDSGVPLFDRTARKVSFSATAAFAAGSAGSAVIVDGVPVTGTASPMPIGSGRIAGLSTLRDGPTVAYEAQLDAIAEALVQSFSETDGTTPLAGLFRIGAGAALPAAGQAGLAAQIALNPAVDPRTGSLALLRDGGMNGAAYRDPGAGAAAYPGRLRALATALNATRTFDPGPALRGRNTLQGFAAASAGWLDGQRADATTEAEYQKTLLARATASLSNAAGVNGDDEIALTLQLERSYTAAAKLLTVVDELLRSLIAAVR